MALDKRIKRIFLENKGQYLGSIVLIVFSCFAFTLMTQFAGNFERLATQFQEAYAQEDAAFRTAQSIDNLPELESAAGAVIEEGRTFDYLLAEGKTLRIFSRNDRVNLPAIIEGRGLSGSGEILVNPQFAATHGYNVGDEIAILGKPFTIVGFAALPNYIYPLQSEVDLMPQPGFGVAVIGKEDIAALDQGSTFYAVKFNAAEQHPRAQSIQFRELLSSRGIDVAEWTNIEDNKRVNIVAAEIDILNMVSKGVPTAIFLLAGVMVANIVWRLINRETAIIGALYAFGYKRKEIYRHYLMLPLSIAVIGGIIGTILGTFPVRYMVSFMLEVFNMPLTGIEFDPGLIVLSLLLPVFILGGSGYLVIRKELKHSPVELMRGTEEKNKVNFLERRLNLDRFRFTTKFRIREQVRSLSRLAFLLTGIAVATMLLQWGFSLKSSMDYLVSGGNLAGVYDFKYEYQFDGLRYEPLPEGAEPYSAALFLPEDDDKRDFYVTGVMPDSDLLTPVDETGARLSTNQVIATKPVARLLNIAPGDTVDIVRKLDGRVFSVQVDSIADTYAGKFIFMPLADYNATFGMPAGSYWGAFSNVPRIFPKTSRTA